MNALWWLLPLVFWVAWRDVKKLLDVLRFALMAQHPNPESH